MAEIIIHDEHGFTHAMRRQMLFFTLAQAGEDLAAKGQTLLWSEEPDGVTLYLDGTRLERILYAELVAVEEGRTRGGR
jgi:hypothetical protein